MTGFYEGEEAGITYQLSFEQMNDLKHYFRGSQGFEPKITTWYNALSRIDKLKIKRLSVPQAPDDFFPDPEPPIESFTQDFDEL